VLEWGAGEDFITPGRIRVLDLFSGAGGVSRGWARVGAHVVGVDHRPMPRYPYQFILGDVFDVLQATDFVNQFDVICASPPCQFFSQTRHLSQNHAGKVDHLTPIAEYALGKYSHKMWVIENVERAPLPPENTVTLCGSMFGLTGLDPRRQLRRHRKFWTPGYTVPQPVCRHNSFRPLGVYGALRDNIPGGGEVAANQAEAEKLMGIDWMLWRELREAIPPVYAEYMARQLRPHLPFPGYKWTEYTYSK
jgi:DNA (cytosine-5)-methyltransferase 1